MNHLQSLKKSNNRYFALRHGESMANQKGLIVSAPENGLKKYGLSETGREQVKSSVNGNDNVKKVTRVISSDFLRAFETAEIAHQLLQIETKIQFKKNLRERFFGDYELQDHSLYQKVWGDDELDSSHKNNNVESADEVMERTTSLIVALENECKDETILLVSHGDALQILQAAFSKTSASLHRSLPHLNTAEFRELTLTD